MTKTDLSLHLGALSIAVALHLPPLALVLYLLGLLVASAQDGPSAS